MKLQFEQGRPIEIVPYDATWPQQFEAIANQLHTCLGALAVQIDHIGSTSVPGLAAKDAIDIQITVNDIDDKLLEGRLTQAGFRIKATISHDNFIGIQEENHPQMRKRFAREIAGERRAHIHIRQVGMLNQRYALLFRDYLRSSSVTRDAYQVIKERLAKLFPNSIEGYLYIKDPLMDLMFEAAEQWAKNKEE